jgi:hypothetical protein
MSRHLKWSLGLTILLARCFMLMNQSIVLHLHINDEMKRREDAALFLCVLYFH